MPPRRIFSTEFAVIIIAVGLLFVMVASSLLLFKPTPSPGASPFWWPLQRTLVRSVDWDENTGRITVLVEYTGSGTVTLNEVYVNGSLDKEALSVPRVLSTNQTTEITLSKIYFPEPTQIAIRIRASDGKDASIVEQFFGIRLEQVDWNQSAGTIGIFVRNTGHERVTLNGIFLNETLDATAIPKPMALDADKTIELILSVPGGTNWDTHTDFPIKVTTLEGVFAEESKPIYGIWIQSINWDRRNGKVGAYVYSNGYDVEVTISDVYVNGTLDTEAIIRLNTLATLRSPSDLWSITLSKTYLDNPTQLTLKVVTADGAFDELTKRPNAYP